VYLSNREKDIILAMNEVNQRTQPLSLLQFFKWLDEEDNSLVKQKFTQEDWRKIVKKPEELKQSNLKVSEEEDIIVDVDEKEVKLYINLIRKLQSEALLEKDFIKSEKEKQLTILLFCDAGKKIKLELFTQYSEYLYAQYETLPKLDAFIEHGFRTEGEIAIKKANTANIIALIATIIAIISIPISVWLTMSDNTDQDILRELRAINQKVMILEPEEE
jgi:hypothetical protein